MEPEEGAMGTSKFVVSQEEVWVAWTSTCNLTSEAREVLGG